MKKNEIEFGKFKDLAYQRPNYDEAKEKLKECISKVKKAKSFEEVDEALHIYEDILANIGTNAQIAGIRATLDTFDAYYEEEDFINSKEMSSLSLVTKKLNQAFLDSKFKEDLNNKYGSLFITTIENEMKLINSSVLSNFSKEKKLCQKYDKVVAQCKTSFRGEECNFYGLLKHMESTDRSERKEAFLAWANLYEQASDKLDDIYDQLVAIRCDSASKLGFKNYTDNAYLNLKRFDYNQNDVKIFREQVKKYVVPEVAKLYQDQAKRLDVYKLQWYDEQLFYPTGNANPIGTKDELVKKAKDMYKELSKETGTYFNFMVKHDLFDLETKPGKAMGGYCTFIDNYKAPFIFANFNGTSADVDTLTHEAGHAFQAYTASRNIDLLSQTWGGYETSEIHSMSMELFTHPWMDKFFGEKADQYRYFHLASCLMAIPYLVSVDEFQHQVYAKPSMTAKERREVWHKIELEYMPWRDYDGNKFLSEGGFWMQKQHIFLDPFYYVDYAIAQTCAFQFYIRNLQNHTEAWKDYLSLCKAGGSKGFKELLTLANLKNPLEEGTLKDVIPEIVNEINKLKEKANNKNK